MTYYSYDVMADLAFGDSMAFIKASSSEVAGRILATFTSSLDAMALMYTMPWLMNALGVLTSIAGPIKDWTDWSVSQTKARIDRHKDAKPDFVGHLINGTPETAPGRALLYGESRLNISAGSETTSPALTFLFMHLSTHPHYMHAVRKEFREHETTYHCQQPLPFLVAVIDESMRRMPSVFFGPQRVTPPEGMTINNHFIPGDTVIQIPFYPIHRDERNFARPDEFMPERWTTNPELLRNKNAYNPFSTGPYNCVGKGLAKMELRSVIGRVINEFDVTLPEGFVAGDYWKNVKDHFTAGPPKQPVSFVKVDH